MWISGNRRFHSLTLASTIPASLPGSGDLMEPWFSEASRAAVSSFRAGTLRTTTDSSNVFASRSSARNPAGRSVYAGGLALGEVVGGQQDGPELVPVQRGRRPEQRGDPGIECVLPCTM